MILIFYILALFLTTFVVGILIGVIFIPPLREKVRHVVTHWRKRPELMLQRVEHNPVLSPLPNSWEEYSVFNPAVVHIDGKFHMLYRALGGDGISRLGYASSEDGTHFDKRLPYPIYLAPRGRKRPSRYPMRYHQGYYPSGGGYGGCEDPRAVVIGKRLYVTYSAFDGWDFIRMAITSIKKEDFISEQWNWNIPTLLSEPGKIQKNWVLFPEKINGKFAILHNLVPTVSIEYRDELENIEENESFIKSEFIHYSNKEGWEGQVRGVGPPPMKTPYGWLVLYHAMDRYDTNRYKLGALLLDLEHPENILYRSPQPILEPDTYYENEGKPNVVYACGAVIKDNTLFVYYGGGDRVVAIASAQLDTFVDALMRDYKPELINI